MSDKPTTTNTLEAIRATGTVLIADTASFREISRFHPSEGTTNPSLLYAAAQQQQQAYSTFLDRTVQYARSLSPVSSPSECLSLAVEFLSVQFGTEIYKITGRVATEVDVSYSFMSEKTVEAALRVIELYAKEGVPKDAVRIKISATWEGIQAARILERDYGVSVLVTIVFGMVQAITAAEAGVSCIAPYVGRIDDWHKARGFQGADMGVQRVKDMQNYLRKYEFRTKVMAASFRNIEQVKRLAGLDLLTVAPGILDQLEKCTDDAPPQLTVESAKAAELPELSYINDEGAFRWAFNWDACAVEKSAEAMRLFAEDTDRLKALLASMITNGRSVDVEYHIIIDPGLPFWCHHHVFEKDDIINCLSETIMYLAPNAIG
ncbi:MAG: sedoheptulose-7-phosphate:D-glyceraldehyde-3- phosphate transaldolase [Cirrosporium novae-zelandiae]|nr:MAG: sedoheptulose-7-phosphate:D-glyceraldehyde-3- phosphate transaldolase [Cirrosporium novae-zelandiae]